MRTESARLRHVPAGKGPGGPGCVTQGCPVITRRLFCTACWGLVPGELRAMLWRSCRCDGEGSARYRSVLVLAVLWAGVRRELASTRRKSAA